MTEQTGVQLIAWCLITLCLLVTGLVWRIWTIERDSRALRSELLRVEASLAWHAVEARIEARAWRVALHYEAKSWRAHAHSLANRLQSHESQLRTAARLLVEANERIAEAEAGVVRLPATAYRTHGGQS